MNPTTLALMAWLVSVAAFLGWIAQVMLDRFGEGFLSGGRMDLKLTNVLWVDESVTAYGRERETTREGTLSRVHCDVWVEKQDGTRILIGDASALEPAE